MSDETQIDVLSASRLVFILFLLISCSSSSSEHLSRGYKFLDVSASLQQANGVFSHLTKHDYKPAVDLITNSSPLNFSLSISLHSRSSLLLTDYSQNYTTLTLSRLSRDKARVRSLLLNHPAATTVRRPEQLQSPVFSGTSQGSGEYFARIGVGQPANQYYMAIDTGSDVSWLQCDPCSDCYQQTDPIYKPSSSSTYKPLGCNTLQCAFLEVSACRTNTCLYQVSYGDGSYTVGNFATETISFGQYGSVPAVAFGCGHDNVGLFSGSAGLLGLGGGRLSLPSQIKATSFSYCLVDKDSRSFSTLEFNSAPPGDSVVAPMLKNALTSTYFYVGLTGISVGGRALKIPASMFDIGADGKGGVIVDSGTAVTRLRTEVYTLVRDTFKSMSPYLRSAGRFSLFDTCYDFSSETTVKVPMISFQFAGGKTLPVRPSNFLIPVDEKGKFCFAFAGTSGPLNIIGNLQQQGTRVTYDLANRNIGFSPNKC
ncbi:hypothetical protein ABFS83_09G050300 [Erythranthe nasuta]